MDVTFVIHDCYVRDTKKNLYPAKQYDYQDRKVIICPLDNCKKEHPYEEDSIPCRTNHLSLTVLKSFSQYARDDQKQLYKSKIVEDPSTKESFCLCFTKGCDEVHLLKKNPKDTASQNPEQILCKTADKTYAICVSIPVNLMDPNGKSFFTRSFFSLDSKITILCPGEECQTTLKEHDYKEGKSTCTIQNIIYEYFDADTLRRKNQNLDTQEMEKEDPTETRYDRTNTTKQNPITKQNPNTNYDNFSSLLDEIEKENDTRQERSGSLSKKWNKMTKGFKRLSTSMKSPFSKSKSNLKEEEKD